MTTPIATPDMRWFGGGGEAPDIGIGDDRTVVAMWPNVRLCARPGQEVVVEATDAVPPEIVEKLRTGSAPALRRYLQGATVMHAAAVALGDCGLLLTGASGAGKSTTAAALCVRGAALLSDDTAVVTMGGDRTVHIEPLESTHWLDVAAAKLLGLAVASCDLDKLPTKATRLATGLVVARALIVLESHSGSSISVERLRGVHAMSAIIAVSLRLPIDKDQDLHDFDAFAHIAATVPIYRVLRPTHFSATLVDELVRTVVQLMELR